MTNLGLLLPWLLLSKRREPSFCTKINPVSKSKAHTVNFLQLNSFIMNCLATKKLIITDGTEQGLNGYGMYFLRANTKKSLGEETFQRDILTGLINASATGFCNFLLNMKIHSDSALFLNCIQSACFGTLKGPSQTSSFPFSTAEQQQTRFLKNSSGRSKRNFFHV